VPSIEGATGKANGLPVFLLLMVVEPCFFRFCPDAFDSAQSATQRIGLSSQDYWQSI